MNNADKAYLDLCQYVLDKGVKKEDRTGVGTYSVFGYQMRFDLNAGFPLLTTKKINMKNIETELKWFIDGNTNIKFLLQHNNNIWNEWAFKKYVSSSEYTGPDMNNFGLKANIDPSFKKLYLEQMEMFKTSILTNEIFASKWGELGDIYGAQWRRRRYYNPLTESIEIIDQLKNSIDMIQNSPSSRRNIVDCWEPGGIDKMALPPCHKSFQFYVSEGKLSCLLEQRSGDIFLGVGYNIASYALLTHLVAKHVGLAVGEFIHNINDAHIYTNHVDQVQLQLSRSPRDLPILNIKDSFRSIYDYDLTDVVLEGYDPHPFIKAPVAV